MTRHNLSSWKTAHRQSLPLMLFAAMLMPGCQSLDLDDDGWSALEGDCRDDDASIHPNAIESCDGIDNDCDGEVDEGLDADADGIPDCSDQEEYDGADNDGDGEIDEGFDADADGIPDASDTELCDGVDNDGDGEIDEGFDADGDAVADCFDLETCDEKDNDGDDLIDEDGACGEPECLSVWQAHALGTLDMVSSRDASVILTNRGTVALCLDEQALYTSALTQTMVWGEAVVSPPVRLRPGETVILYSGENTGSGGSSDLRWWCLEKEQYVSEGARFDYFGEEAPGEILHFINDETDEDADGIEDHLDAAADGVQTNQNLWDFQLTHAALTVGKRATPRDDEVEVTLTSRNLGYHAASGVLTDVIPSGWRLITTSAGATSITHRSDGSTVLTFDVAVEGIEAGTVSARTITYLMAPGSDLASDYLELEPADVYYFDQYEWDMNYSLPAAVYGLAPG